MKPPIYIGCSMDISDDDLEMITEEIQRRFGTECVNWWERGTLYNDEDLRDAKAFLIVPPNNDFRFSTAELTFGLHKELRRARELLRIPVYLIYETREGSIRAYKTKQQGSNFEGIAGTTVEAHLELKALCALFYTRDAQALISQVHEDSDKFWWLKVI